MSTDIIDDDDDDDDDDVDGDGDGNGDVDDDVCHSANGGTGNDAPEL